MKIIVRFTQARWDAFSDYLMPKLPGAVPIIDDGQGAMQSFLRAMQEAGADPALVLEDDIILTKDFLQKAQAVIRLKRFDVIQFFSRSAKDLTVGARWRPGSSFSMNQCTYYPADLCNGLKSFHGRWKRLAEHPTGYDLMVADYLAELRQRYWQHVPSLVEHRVGPSAIDRRRSSKRQSMTFTDPDTEGLE